MARYDAVVIGAGPAGLSAAGLLAAKGAKTLLVDEHAAPGGQIYRAIEGASAAQLRALGPDYARGAETVRRFRASGAEYWPGATLWHATPNRELWISRDGASEVVTAELVILATGAQERPVPLPGWTLPGVMTCGALQILLKSGGLLAEGAVLAGSGPLLYLIAAQAIAAGTKPAAIVDTTPRGAVCRGLSHLGAALASGPGRATLWKGLMLQATIRSSGVAWHRACTDLAIEGTERAEAIRFLSRGRRMRIAARVIALHEGVIPSQQISRGLGLAHVWDAAQAAFRPVVDEWGRSSVADILVAGDGVGIFGAVAAEHAGRIAAAEALRRLGRIDEPARNALAEADRTALAAQRAIRPMLEAMYPPPAAVLCPADEVVVCRCENITAGEVRGAVAQGCLGPNQVKAFLRSGMGPCQGRMCGPSVAQIVAQKRGVGMDEVGYFRIRPPFKPVSVAELAGTVAPEDAERGASTGAPEAVW